MNVAEYIAQFLVSKKVRHIFGFQGGAVLKIIDEAIKTGQIRYIQNYHEQASAFSADAYARVSGNIGVAVATSGPGATNLITGIANAQLDSIPTLFITGQEYSSRLKKVDGIRTNGFQDLDIVSVVQPITKYAVSVMDAQKIAYELEKAFYLATTGRPGAVLIDIPIDIQFETLHVAQLIHFQEEGPLASLKPTQEALTDVMTLLKTAKRPLILCGGGIHLAGAKALLQELVTRTKIPVTVTLNGLDSYPEAIGFSGLYGNVASCLSVFHADVLVVLGARLGQHQVGKSKALFTRAKVIHVDIDPLELGRSIEEHISIRACLKSFLIAAIKAVTEQPLPNYQPWRQQISLWQNRYPEEQAPKILGLSPLSLVKKAQHYLGEGAIICSDVGQNQMWLAQAISLKKNQRLLNSSGLGSMGYALPAAIGAKYCTPEAVVVAFMGDGGFQMNLQELQLILLQQLDIKIIVLNNNTLGLIKTTQDKYYQERHFGCSQPDYGAPDLQKIAAAYQLPYWKLTKETDLHLLAEAFATKGAVLIEAIIHPNFPLKTRHEMQDIFKDEWLDDEN